MMDTDFNHNTLLLSQPHSIQIFVTQGYVLEGYIFLWPAEEEFAVSTLTP